MLNEFFVRKAALFVAVQECDATMLNSIINAGYIIIPSLIFDDLIIFKVEQTFAGLFLDPVQ